MSRRRSRGLPVLTAGLVPALLVGLMAPMLAAAAPPRSAEALALTAQPTTGPPPLLVQFQLTRPNGTLPALGWAFGDGQYLNGSSPDDYTPSHRYESTGSFRCVVTIHWPQGPTNATIPIVVSPQLTARIAASPTHGNPPLTVWFNATVLGGSGTYLRYDWSFGDGGNGSGLSLRYTYTTAGQYGVGFRTSDTDGATANASTVVVVTAVTSPSAGNATTDPGPVPVLPLALGLVIGAAVAAGAAYGAVRRFRPGEPPAPPPAVERPAPARPEAPAGPPAGEPMPPAAPSEPPEAPPGPRVGLTPEAPPSTLATPTRITDALVRHLAGLPKLWPNDIPSKAWTQAGIADAIGAGQSAVSRVLRRLVAAGIVTVETRHVGGSDRRLRIYRLTERGERLGKALREIPPRDPEPPP